LNFSSKRQLLLTTAYRLFNKYGFHPTGIDLIIKESGASKATLYKYFKTKETLIIEVLKSHQKLVIKSLKTSIANNKNDEEPVLSIFDDYSLWFKQKYFHGCFFHRAALEYSDFNSPIHQCSIQAKQQLLELIIQSLKETNHYESSLKDKGQSLMILLDGAIVDAQIFHRSDSAIKAKQIASVILKDRN